MSLKFCANLSFMFVENCENIILQYKAAKLAGFNGVECGIPLGNTLEEIVAVKNETGLQQVLLNIYRENVAGDEFGCAALLKSTNQFLNNLNKTIIYANALNCKKIHIMAGKVGDNVTDENHSIYIENLREAAKLLKENNIIGLIEPINKYSVPGYYLDNYKRAIAVINEINSPHIKLMLDIFHLQQIEGNVTHRIKDYMPYVGHVQIAQVPNRKEPNTLGELNYSFILKELINAGYNDWVGCEYFGAAEGLSWVTEFGYKL